MIFVIILYVLMSFTFIFGKAALSYCEPIFFTGVRMFLAGAILIIYYYFHHPQKFKEYVQLQYIRFWLVLAVFNIYLTNVLDFWGLKTLSAAKTSFILSLSPFFAVLFSYIIFGERMTMRKLIGLAIGFIGFIPILLHRTQAEELLGGISFLSWAELSVLGAAIASALGWNIMRHSIHRKAYPLVLSNAISMLIGSLMVFPTSLVLEQWHPIPVTNYTKFVVYILIVVFISNIMTYNLYALLLKRYTATFLSLAGFMTPLFAALIGWIFLGEIVGWHFFVSTLIVFCGLFIFYQEELRLGYIMRGHL